MTPRAMSMVLIISTIAAAENEWSSASQRDDWRLQLEMESTGENTATALFDPTGQLVGLSGHFPLPDKEVETVVSWLVEHKSMLGLTSEGLSLTDVRAFWEAIPQNEESIDDVASGYVYSFAVIEGDTSPTNVQIRLVVDLRTGPVIRGLYNSFYPPVAGRLAPNLGFTEADAWFAAKAFLGTNPAIKLAANRIWSSAAWLIERIPKEKEFLWVLKLQDQDGAVRTLIVSPSTAAVQFASLAMDQFDPMPQEHRGYGAAGMVYWDSLTSQGCLALGGSCTNPAFDASVHGRTEIPFMLESWKNLSSQSGSPFDWPWIENNKSPLRSSLRDPSGLPTQSLKVTLAHSGNECVGAFGGGSPPCSNYTGMWFGIGDVSIDLYGHEYGHSAFKDLKMGGGAVTTKSGAFVEFFADFVGITTEDLRLRWLDPNPKGSRTDFQIHSVSNGSTIDWPTATCQPVFVSSERGALGRGMYEGWRSLNLTPAARDVLFRAWRLTAINALYYATDFFPTGLDFVAAMLSMQPPNQLVFNPYPYPNAHLASALISTGCW
ncbi:MAG: hypothetical protein U0228_35230 [Myxococcaceae bacterium]